MSGERSTFSTDLDMLDYLLCFSSVLSSAQTIDWEEFLMWYSSLRENTWHLNITLIQKHIQQSGFKWPIKTKSLSRSFMQTKKIFLQCNIINFMMTENSTESVCFCSCVHESIGYADELIDAAMFFKKRNRNQWFDRIHYIKTIIVWIVGSYKLSLYLHLYDKVPSYYYNDRDNLPKQHILCNICYTVLHYCVSLLQRCSIGLYV